MYHGSGVVHRLLRHTLTRHLLHVLGLLHICHITLHRHLVLLLAIVSSVILVLLLVLFFLATSFKSGVGVFRAFFLLIVVRLFTLFFDVLNLTKLAHSLTIVDWLILLGNESTIFVNQVRELLEVLKDWVTVHLLFELLVRGLLRVELEDGKEDVFEATERIYWTAITLRSLEEVLCSWVCPLIGILSGSTPATARCWRVPELTIRSL